MKQRMGFPNLSVKLYEDITALQENRFLELSATITSLTLRDSLFGQNTGLLQFYDSGTMHTKMDGEQLVTISVKNANASKVQNRVYSTSHFGVTVDDKGDNILTCQLEPFHKAIDLKFSRAFFTNASDSLAEMIRVIYRGTEDLIPMINGINVYVPRVAWIGNYDGYCNYVREVGMSVDNESFPFVFEDFRGINVTDWKTITDQEITYMAVGSPEVISDYVDDMDVPLVWDFEWETKSNQKTRRPHENVTIYSYSPSTKTIERIVVGDGTNSVMLNRSGSYRDMTYGNGYEEGIRLQTLSQYDSYANCKMYGNFEVYPSQKIIFKDLKDQFKTIFYVDTVIHEITQNDSRTTLYVFTHSKDLREVDLVKVKPVQVPINSDAYDADGNLVEEYDEGYDANKSKEGYEWDLNKMSAVVVKNAAGRTKGMGACAKYVRMALEVSQIKHFFSGGLGDANTVGPKLLKMGWEIVGNNVVAVKKGDIAIFQRTSTPKGKIYGHICIFTGSIWVSDFIQSSVQPSRSAKLPYTLYRAKKGLG